MRIDLHQTAISFLLAATIVGGCLTTSSASVAVAGELRVGTAAVKITPPNGTPMAGGYGRNESQGVLDDLYAKAAILDDGHASVALVACDVIGLTRSAVVEARRIIAEKTGIPADHVMISATHTHTGPVVIGDSTLDDMTSGGSQLSKDFAEQLPKSIAQAVEQAHGRLMPARISYAQQDEPGISFIRRFWMKDGTIGWNPGQLNPNIIRPIGTIDPQVNVVYAETADKKPILTYVNFGMHACTTGGSKISADFPASLASRLADYKGPEMLTLYANGALGDVNHVDVQSSVGQTSPEEAKRLGTILSAAVLKSYMRLKEVDDATLRTRSELVRLPLRPYTEEELRAARDIAAGNGKKGTFLEQVKAYRVLDVAARNGKPYEADVQVFSLGRDIVWVALPCEPFAAMGRSVKTASQFRQTSVVGLANSGSGYVPDCSAYAEGQYEAVSTRYVQGTGEMLVATAIRLLAELHRDASGGKK